MTLSRLFFKSALAIAFVLLASVSSYADGPFGKITVNSNTTFIAQLYIELLERAPQASEINTLLSALNSGGERADTVNAILNSTEYKTKVISDLYSTFLNRSVDSASLSSFLNLFEQGAHAEDIKKTILDSSEYLQLIGQGSNETFFDTIYSNLLGRMPSLAEIQIFLPQLQTTNGQAIVVQNILSSKEYFTRLVTGFYQKYLGRPASQVELNFAVEELGQGGASEDLLSEILGSGEYYSPFVSSFYAGSVFHGIVTGFAVSDLTLAPEDFSTSILWGDDTRKAKAETVAVGGGKFAVIGTHTYKAAGDYIITITTGGRVKLTLKSRITIKKPFTSVISKTPDSKGASRVAVGDVNGDGIDDIIGGALPGGSPYINIFSGMTGNSLGRFLAFDASFKGGVFVASGDVNGDGFADIIVGSDAGGAPQVKVFSGKDYSPLASFFAFDSAFSGGVRVAAGDIDGDGLDDIIAGAGPGATPQVKVFDASDFSVLQDFLAYDSGYIGGVFVASGDVNGDGTADIITGPGVKSAPQVKVFDASNLQILQSFLAADTSFSGGVRVAAGDVNGDGISDIITGSGAGVSARAKVFDGNNLTILHDFLPFNLSFTGGIFVAAGDVTGQAKISLVSGVGSGISGRISIKRN